MPGVFLYSTKRLTNNERNSFSISPYINEVIIGLSLGLAYWAMDDGAKLSSGFLLCTHSFLLSDVELLTKVLKSKFDLDTSLYTNKKEYSSIYIKTSSMGKFRELVSKHFHVSMKYKIEP